MQPPDVDLRVAPYPQFASAYASTLSRSSSGSVELWPLRRSSRSTVPLTSRSSRFALSMSLIE
eukprot:10339980-Heterocapsa_arctica.AAC.1